MSEIHPSAIVSDQAILADDVVVGPFAVIDAGVTIGARCKICLLYTSDAADE